MLTRPGAIAVTALAVLAAGCAGHHDATAETSSATLPLLPPSRTAPVSSDQLPSVAPKTGDVSCSYLPSAGSVAKKVNPPRDVVTADPATIPATIDTDHGAIGLSLNNAESPCTVNSFVSLAQQGYFDDTPCHRLTTAASLGVLQCGDPTGQGTGGPGYQFANEYPTDSYAPGDPAQRLPISYPRGTLAMANAGPGTNGSQFFLVYADSQLPPQYTVFGTIDPAGLAVLDTIGAAGVSGGGTDGAPATPVTITSVQAG